MIKLPKIIGHRGAAGYAPENTLESIHTAADMGVKWVELDVKLTKDQIPVIFHDDTLNRTTNGSGNMADTLFSDLRAFETGSWYSDSFAGITVPTLEEAIDVILERDLGLNLEIKPCPGREKETAEVAMDVLSQIWDDHERLLISSFSQVSLETARDMSGDWARGLLLGGKTPEDMPANWKEIAEYLEVTTMNIGSKLITKALCEEIMNAEYPLLVYTVNQPDEARRFRQWGVDVLFSDTPDVIEEVMGKLN